MSLIYIFTFSKVETEQVARLLGAAVKGKPPARVGPSRVGPNEVVLFASDMGPKLARSLANSVLNDGAQTQGQESGNPKPDAILIWGYPLDSGSPYILWFRRRSSSNRHVSGWFHCHGLLDQPKKQFATAA